MGKMTAVAAGLGTVSVKDVEQTYAAIKMRNDVIHDGWEPTENAKIEASASLRTVALLHSVGFKFPMINPGKIRCPQKEKE